MVHDHKKELGNVLVVDNAPDIRANRVQMLTRCGFTVDSAANGQEALYKFILLRPDLILMAADLPVLDGFRTCAALRQDPNGKDVPVLLMLEVNVENVSRAYEAGATDVINLPVNWESLAHRASLILRGSKALKRLRRDEEALERAQRIARMGSWEWDLKAKEVVWSPELNRIMGLDRDAAKSFEMMMEVVHPDDKVDVGRLMKDAFQAGRDFSRDHRIRRPNGEIRHVHQQVEVTINSRGEPARLYGIVQDINERVKSLEKIRYMAYYNALSGLPNRQFFKEALREGLMNCEKTSQMMGIYFIDLDSFKKVNDTFGHAYGDLLLLEVARRLQAFVQGLELVTNPEERTLVLAHSGGGRFLMLVYPFDNEAEYHRLAPQILSQLAQPYQIQQRELFVTASMGISVHPYDGDDVDTLLKCGERAIYHAKSVGKNCFQMYSSELHRGSMEKLNLEVDLRKALARGELELYFQPKLDLAVAQITGVEALIRWNHPKWGMLGPDKFIPLAEENGLILPIGEWVIRRACVVNKSWQKPGYPTISVAVNLSARQFLQQPIVAVIRQALADSGLAASSLEVEVTESLMMKNVDESIGILSNLKDMGIKVAIDDFGTGYSSLSYLKRLPIDVIKIDKAFVHNLDTDQENQAITASILALCSRLGLKVVAEGVEHRACLSMLEKMNCDIAQGYLIGRPLKAEDVPPLLGPDFYRTLVNYQEPARTE